MGKLVLQLPNGKTLDIPLDRERINIGRRADNDVCLPFPAVSGEHASVVTILGDSFLEDRNSTNGTLVNGRPIGKHFLRDGDEIDIGQQVLIYRVDATIADPRQASLARAAAAVQLTAARAVTDDALAETLPPMSSTKRASPSGDGSVAGPVQRMSDKTERPEERSSRPHSVTESRIDRDSDGRVAGSLLAAEPMPERRTSTTHSAGGDRTGPHVRVIDGPNAGRVVAMQGDQLIIGRVGEAIVALYRVEDGFRLVPVEGDGVVTVNGAPLPQEGRAVSSGDTVEIARTRVQFLAPERSH